MTAGPPGWVESYGHRIKTHPWRSATAVARAFPSVGGDFHHTWRPHGGMKAFMKMRTSRWPPRSVAAVARVTLDRRSEIGSHTPPKITIFIRGGELEKVMGHFHDNASFGSPADSLFREAWAFGCQEEAHGSRRLVSPIRSPWLPLPFINRVDLNSHGALKCKQRLGITLIA